MRNKTVFNILSTTLTMTFVLVFLSGCIGDQQIAKRAGIIKDFSTSTGKKGCGSSYFVYEKPYDTCISTCETGYHAATASELEEVKKELADNAGYTFDGVDTADILMRVNNSANICLADVYIEKRPTNAMTINNDFCSCINGKSDIINDCDAICASKPVSADPILYGIMTPSFEISTNTRIKNLHNWCNLQLESDDQTPKCMLEAYDGNQTRYLSMDTNPNSNSFTANVSQLDRGKAWVIKIIESINVNEDGSYNQSQSFHFRRKNLVVESDDPVGAIKITPISQYSCLSYGGSPNAGSGTVNLDSYIKNFYYFATNEVPPPVAPLPADGSAGKVVCHNEILHPGNDSILYDRLDLIPGMFTMWDKNDSRFIAKQENQGKLTINKIIEDKLVNEYGYVNPQIGLFTLMSYPNRPSTQNSQAQSIPMGYIMSPFREQGSDRSYCPGEGHYNSNSPIMRILGEFMDATEGLYITESQPEVIYSGTTPQTVYVTMFATESLILKYGFYIEAGIKMRADSSTIHSKAVHFYWPINKDGDPLLQGNRKLFSVKAPDTLNGQAPTGQQTTSRTTDKRLGCVPKTSLAPLEQ